MEATVTLLYSIVFGVMYTLIGIAGLVTLTWVVLNYTQSSYLAGFESGLYNIVPIKQNEIPKFLRYTTLMFLILF